MKSAQLGKITKIVSGATPKTGVAEYWDGEVPWATPADLSKLNGPYISETPRKLTAIGVRSCATTVLPAGSVLLSSRAPIGHVAVNTVPMATNQGFKSLVPGPDVDAKYLYHWLKSRTDYLQSLGNGATFKELSKKTTEQILVPLPPLPEQRRIAAILDHADALRTKRRQVLAHLDSLTQAVFTEMFSAGDFDPVQAGVLMPNMRNGLSPATSGTHKAQVLTLASVTQGLFNPSAVKPGVFAIEPPADKRITNRDFLMCRGNGNKAFVGVGTYARENRPDLVFPDTVIAGTVDKTLVTMPFLEAAWRRRDIRAQIESVARTTNGTYKVNQRTLSGVVVRVPPLDLQEAFAARVARAAQQHAAVQRATTADNELFASLQARAFRGEL